MRSAGSAGGWHGCCCCGCCIVKMLLASVQSRRTPALACLTVLLLACSCGSTSPVAPAVTAQPPVDATSADGGSPPPSASLTPATDNGFRGASGKWINVDDSFFLDRLNTARAPGAAVALVKDARVVWSKGYGYADATARRAATPDTRFMLASISKTVVAVALMQLLERDPRGLSVLGADVQFGLPFSFRNPAYPNVPITFRMLMTHRWSMVDGPFFENFTFVQGDSPVPLASFLGDYGPDAGNWSKAAPGTESSYSNAGATMLGYLVERLSGMNLQEYCTSFVFGPLGMKESSWFLAGLDPNHIAMPYEFERGVFNPQGLYGFPDYPDGQLRTSAVQLARFLMMFSGDGALNGARLLQPATVAEMKRPQVAPPNDHQGLVFYGIDVGPVRLLGHNGSYDGVSTDMWFDPATRSGYILLTNGGAYLHGTTAENDAMIEINDKLLELALSAQ